MFARVALIGFYDNIKPINRYDRRSSNIIVLSIYTNNIELSNMQPIQGLYTP